MLQETPVAQPQSRDNHPTAQLLDDSATKQIAYRARRLARKFCLNRQDTEDLRQDFALTLLQAQGSFDPVKGCRSTFIGVVLDRRYRHHVRQFSARDRLGVSRPMSLENIESDPQRVRPDPRAQDDLAQVDLREDIQTVLARMPERLRRFCVAMMEEGLPCRAAKRLGVSPSTVTRALPLIRQFFAEAGYGEEFAFDAKETPQPQKKTDRGPTRRTRPHVVIGGQGAV